eukprot:2482982-Prymnesium_polylepis.1
MGARPLFDRARGLRRFRCARSPRPAPLCAAAASKARLHAAAVSAADKRLGQLREAVTDAEAELARVAERP